MKRIAFQVFMLGPLLACVALSSTYSAARDGALRERWKQRWAQRHAPQDAAAGAGDAATDAASVDSDRRMTPGSHTLTIEHAGLTRMYLVHAPASYDPAMPAAVLFALHGGGGSMTYQADDSKYGLITKSEREGFIAVFPNGYSKLASGKFATWNAGKCCGGARDRQVDDVGFIRRIVADLGRRLNIDRHRIFATGMSNGAMMSYRLACEMPDVFAAIAAVAGTDNTVSCEPGNPISVLHIHAKNDDHVLFDGGAGQAVGRNPSMVTDFTSVPASIAKWVQRNGCAATPRRILENAGAYCDVYDGCNASAAVQLCVTATGGHSWPGGHKDRGEPPSQAISANDVMWEFFNRR